MSSKKVQQEIPGTQRKDAIPELDDAGAEYKKLEDQVKRLKAKLKEAESSLDELLVKHNRQKYVYYDGRTKRTIDYKAGARKVRVRDEPMPTDWDAVTRPKPKGKGNATAAPPAPAVG